MNKPRTLEGASTFVGSFPKSAIMAPNLEEPKLFLLWNELGKGR